MRVHSPSLVDQAELVSRELIRVAVLWHEQWHDALEDASRFSLVNTTQKRCLKHWNHYIKCCKRDQKR